MKFHEIVIFQVDMVFQDFVVNAIEIIDTSMKYQNSWAFGKKYRHLKVQDIYKATTPREIWLDYVIKDIQNMHRSCN